MTAFKNLILSSTLNNERSKKLHFQVILLWIFDEVEFFEFLMDFIFQNLSSSSVATKIIAKEKSKLDKKESEFLI